jgi:2-octaprenyl-6-methoxyphenol hydroxylase
VPEQAPLVIAGDGPVAGVLALALSAQEIPFVLLGEGRPGADRPIALSHGTWLLFDRLQVLRGVASTPIENIHVSQRGRFGRTVIRAVDENVPALGRVVSFAALGESITARLESVRVKASVTRCTPSPQGESIDVTARTAEGKELAFRTPLLVLAEGGRSLRALRGSAPRHPRHDPGERHRDYRQSAVVAEVTTEKPHCNWAYERFTVEGPLALLPHGDRSALVWSTTHASAHALCALQERAFLARLQEAFGGRLGRFVAAGPRAAFAVALRYERSGPLARTVVIGNAAQTLHPVAGQGLNLGVRDAWELAEHIAATPAADLGSGAFVRTYVGARAADRQAGIRATDAMVRLFSNDNAILGLARGAGLAAMDIAAPARRFFARRMMFGTRGL